MVNKMRKLTTLLLSATLSLGAAATQTDAPARLLRFPATNGKEVTFAFAGDLYSVSVDGGEARRLTSHMGYEMFPRYSPDGRSIAFTGEYDGNREVYLIPSEGGAPVRLTWTATNGRDELGDRMGPNNIVMCWTPDGKGVVYRNRISDGFAGELWTVPADGAMPTRLPLPEGGFCSWSPDGKKLAYNRVMREFRTWKYYRGGMADDIWIWDGKKGQVTNITDNVAQDIFPMWCGSQIFFASDRDMTMNIFVYDTKTGKTEKVTDFHDYDVKFPSTSGDLIVFEQAGYIWKLDPATREYSRIDIRLTSDDVWARTRNADVSGRLSGMSVAPDGSRLAVIARGEVFNVPATPGVTRNISRTPGANERGATWSPDGKSIVYISDVTGECELWIRNVADDDDESRQLTKGGDTYIRSVQWSPDGSKLLYTDRKNRVVEVDPATGAKNVLMQVAEGEPYGISYSADSKWLAYTRPAENHMGIVYVREIASGREYPVTEKWYNSSSPFFSEDGKYLIFSSDRDFNPIYSRIEWNYAYTNQSGLYMAMLSKDTPSPFIARDGETAAASKKDGDKGEKTVKVDPKGLSERIVRIPVKNAGRAFYCDGKKLWFTSGRTTSVFDFSRQTTDKCCDATVNYRFGDKKAVCNAGHGEVYVADFPASKVNLGKKVDLGDRKSVV